MPRVFTSCLAAGLAAAPTTTVGMALQMEDRLTLLSDHTLRMECPRVGPAIYLGICERFVASLHAHGVWLGCNMRLKELIEHFVGRDWGTGVVVLQHHEVVVILGQDWQVQGHSLWALSSCAQQHLHSASVRSMLPCSQKRGTDISRLASEAFLLQCITCRLSANRLAVCSVKASAL